MQTWDSSQRFTALHKAIGKMSGAVAAVAVTAPEQRVALPWGFAVEGEDDVAEPVRVKVAEPEARVRPVVAPGVPMAWVLAEAVASAERRGKRLARVRAERELAAERQRMVQKVDNLRLARMERAVRQSRSDVVAMEERLRNGGHTGRLGWMEAQVLKVREMVSQA